MLTLLRHQLAAPELHSRLTKLAGNAPAAAPLSLRLELGKLDTDWLYLLPASSPFWYYAQPSQQVFRLGIGHALQVTSTGPHRFAALDNAFAGLGQHWRSEGPPLLFAGFAFDPRNDAPLPNALLAIPAILLENLNGVCSATLTIPAGRISQAPDEWQQLLRSQAKAEPVELLASRLEALPKRAWIARVTAALRDINAGHVDKLVLSRCKKVEGKQDFSPAQVLGNLVQQQATSLIYAYGNGQQTFLGATPEQLVELSGQQLSADALAGTAWPGSAALAGQKNQHEQSLVVRAVCAALAPYCMTSPRISLAQEHPAGHLMHLRSQIAAKVYPGTTLFDLVGALHPTPAVGGFPVPTALDWLNAHHEQRPGWYSGGFGLLSLDGSGEFSVALRSALLDGNTAELQAGAGIVAGSDPEQELAETEAKLETMLAALGPAISSENHSAQKLARR
jgi:isochorismate synthase